MKKKLFTVITLGLFSVSLISCGNKNKDISIIYTTDVHCGLSENLGYASLYSYKESLSKSNYVTLVDSGDYLQGDFIGAISNGEYVIEAMNKTGYDIVTLGNHEFDYGMDTLSTRLKEFKGDVVSCNFSYIGSKENKFDFIKPYVIKKYGNKKVGYLGVTTPTTLVESNPDNFMEDGKIAYDFHAPDKDSFYNYVQDNINKCKKDGADYVVLLSHLGSLSNYAPYSSIDVIKNTSGAVAFLDGHAHVTLPWTTYKNKDNKDTLLVDTGYKLNAFASLAIKKDGNLSYEYYDSYPTKSEMIASFIKELEDKADEQGNKVVASIDVDLKITDENGIRMIRNRELPIGNLVSDAYRNIAGSDIGVVNGGGVRANLYAGDVTYKDVKNVHPFGNTLMKKRVTGQQILDYLEFVCRFTEKEYVKDGLPNGENGEFAQVSGLKFSIDTSIPNSVVTDSNGNYIRIDGPRRVKNVLVLENDNYVDIDPLKEYVLASHDFLLEKGGGGANMFVDCPVVASPQMLDYEILVSYISNVLKGKLKDKYSAPEGRINIL